MKSSPALRTPESQDWAPDGSTAWLGSWARAGSSVTVCGERPALTHRTAWPTVIVTSAGSKRNSGVRVTVTDGAGVPATGAPGVAAGWGGAPGFWTGA